MQSPPRGSIQLTKVYMVSKPAKTRPACTVTSPRIHPSSIVGVCQGRVVPATPTRFSCNLSSAPIILLLSRLLFWEARRFQQKKKNLPWAACYHCTLCISLRLARAEPAVEANGEQPDRRPGYPHTTVAPSSRQSPSLTSYPYSLTFVPAGSPQLFCFHAFVASMSR